jgi:AraC family transcriptional regulator
MTNQNRDRRLLIKEYISRINKVIDYIENNLGKNFTLDELARVANFSKFHFHRIFNSFIGETLFQFIQRIRLERSAIALIIYPKKSVTEIAMESGFSSSSAFARRFKDYFKMSASAWRKQKIWNESNLGQSKSNKNQQLRNLEKEIPRSSIYIDYTEQSQIWRISMNDTERIVEVKQLPEKTVAYVRHIGPYKGDAELFGRLSEKLFTWAGPRDLLNFPETQYLIVYHDTPEVTEESKLRTSVCITVPEGTAVDGEIGKMNVVGGKYAMAHFELMPHEYENAWKWVYGVWFPKSGFVPADGPPFELYHDVKECQSTGKCAVDICVPVKPL